MRKLPIGVSEFSKIIEGDYYFVDKSLLIDELFNEGADVVLFTRPRRFGKTLNMRMLYSFLNNSEDNSKIFKGLKIENTPSFSKINAFPVIYITFKDIKDRKWEDSFNGIAFLISKLYAEYGYIPDFLEKEADIEYYNKILMQQATKKDYENAILNLCSYLHKYHNERVWILIDEYDVPIQSGYMNGFYDEAVDFFRNFMSAMFKDNPFLYKGVITGIYRVSKESIFSGLNNLKVYTILSEKYGNYFGFTEDEVYEALTYYNQEGSIEDVRKWYNGYTFGNFDGIYNPWSILNYLSDKKLQPYWVSTSSNDLIREQVETNDELESELPLLLEGKSVEKVIHPDTSLREIQQDESAVWSLLLFSGYLKASFSRQVEDEIYYKLSVPNIEVRSFFKYTVGLWLKSKLKLKENRITMHMRHLLEGDPEGFIYYLKEMVMQILSYFDTGDETEKVYKVFTLGLLTIGANGYTVRSEKESGYGRYDVAIYPKDKNKFGAVIEFKMKEYNESLEEAAERALKQIDEKKYISDLKSEGIKNILKFGIAIDGKNMSVKYAKG